MANKKVFNPIGMPFDTVRDDLADLTTKSHTALSDIGTNTHAQIDTHISASNPHSGSAPLASPTFTGTPTAPTPSATDDSTKIATTAFVNDWQIRAYPEDLASFKLRMTTGKNFNEFFDSTSLPAGHSWASDATFTALTAGTGSGTYDLTTYPSALWYDVRTGVRSFLYKSGTPTTSLIFTGGFGSAGTDSTVAVRLDDGTDNNYVEGGLVSQSSGASWSWQMKTRSGGGAVTTTTSADNVVVPFVFNMLLNITGTKWSSWSANFWISIPYAAPAVLQMNKVAPSFTMTWTPTRYGLTMRAPVSGANIGLVDHWGWNP